jgi:GNAT superfamily N-acetyltransferase
VLAQLPVVGSTVALREAVAEDVPALVQLLAADQLGSTRDGISTAADLQPYLRAFVAIDSDPAHLLLVAADGTRILATMQLSFLPGLARRGALRAQIEAVRVRQDHRSRGLGAALFEWAIQEARRRDCALMQLTTDKSRADAPPLLRAPRVRGLARGAKAHLAPVVHRWTTGHGQHRRCPSAYRKSIPLRHKITGAGRSRQGGLAFHAAAESVIGVRGGGARRGR